MSSCKECVKQQRKESYEANGDAIRDRVSKYRKKNKNKLSLYGKRYRELNKYKISEYQKKYSIENRNKINEYRRAWHKKRYDIDITYRIKVILRSHLAHVKNRKCYNRSTEIIGCTYDQLLVHLLLSLNKEERIKYINKPSDYEIDHIIPISWAEDVESAIELNSYKNLQLLKKYENKSKSNKHCF